MSPVFGKKKREESTVAILDIESGPKQRVDTGRAITTELIFQVESALPFVRRPMDVYREKSRVEDRALV